MLRHVKPLGAVYILAVVLLSVAGCTPSAPTSAGRSGQSTGNGVLGWPFDPSQGPWVIENGYNWNTSNGGLDHGCSTLYQSCYELDSFDFQRTGPPGSTAGQTILSPATGDVLDVSSAVNGAGRCVRIAPDGHAGYYLMICHVDNPHTGHLDKGQPLGTVNTRLDYGDHIHMTLYSLTPGTADSAANAAKRQPMPFSGPWTIGGCSYPADERSQHQWAGTSVPCASGGGQQSADHLIYAAAVNTDTSSSYTGYLYALKASDGSIRWKNASSDATATTPAKDAPVYFIGAGDVEGLMQVQDGVLYFVSNSGDLRAVAASTGATKWHLHVGKFLGGLAIVGGAVYGAAAADEGPYGPTNPHFFAVRADTGTLIWRTPLLDDGIQGVLQPTLANGMLYVADYANGLTVLYAFDAATGAMRWHLRSQEPPEQTAPPVVVGTRIYLDWWTNRDSGHLAALDALTGATVWENTQAHFEDTQIQVVNGIVYAMGHKAPGDGGLYALDATSGHVVWTVKSDGGVFGVFGNVVYLANSGTVAAFDAHSGAPIWRTTPGSELTFGNFYSWREPPAFDGHTMYLLARRFRPSDFQFYSVVYAFDVQSGQLRWRYATPPADDHGAQVFPPVVADGAVYLANNEVGADTPQDDGCFVYALDSGNGSLRWRQKLSTYQIGAVTIGP